MQADRIFTSSGYIADGQICSQSGQILKISLLPAFLRTLLSTDGTVTKSLESYFWEPVIVDNLGQSRIIMTERDPVLGRSPGDTVLKRHIQLRGAQSKTIYATAASLIYLAGLTDDIAADLEAGQVGIGELLRDCGLETYREILDCGECEKIADDPNWQRAVWRTYRINMGQQPLIKVTETFPLAVYE